MAFLGAECPKCGRFIDDEVWATDHGHEIICDCGQHLKVWYKDDAVYLLTPEKWGEWSALAKVKDDV